jgi:ubiquinone biosynthesis protein
VTFTKLGQLLSTRRDLLPEEFTAELGQLQDRAEPAPWEQVEEVIAQSLGVPAGQVFAALTPVPAAAASIAQVHHARLRCGDGSDAEVAVKVQRPGIRSTVEQDLDILMSIAAKLESRTRWARTYGLVALSQGFAAAMREELDFRVEARNMTAMAASWPAQQRAVGGSVRVALPALYDQVSSERVLVIEWLDGVSLRKAGPLIDDRGLDRTELTRVLMRSMVYQLTEGGVFHADPHPGNIMLLADGRLALLDFGSVGRLDAQLRSGLQNLLLAIGRGDPAAFRDALLDLLGSRAALMARARTVVERWIGEQDGRLRWLRPEAGAFCCARLNPNVFGPPDVRRFYDRLSDRRTLVAPGWWFGDSARVMRLGLAYPPDDELEKGLMVISDALRP